MIRRLIPLLSLFLAVVSSAAEPVTIRRVLVDGVRIDLIEPPGEQEFEGSVVVLFYRDQLDSLSDRFIAGRIWQRTGAVTRVQGEALQGDSVRLRVYFRRKHSEIIDQVIFTLTTSLTGPPTIHFVMSGYSDARIRGVGDPPQRPAERPSGAGIAAAHSAGRTYGKLKNVMPYKGDKYNKKTYSLQQSRRDKRNRKLNRPRLARLKGETGCQHCGRKDLPPEELHAHHLGEKYKNIAWLLGRPWRRVTAEITGTKLPGIKKSGGPIIFLCQQCHTKAHTTKRKASKGGRR